jgi:hypothetical protein
MAKVDLAQGVTGGLDDVIKPDATSGSFYLSDIADNRELTVHATVLHGNEYYASVGNAFGQVDPSTGASTALVSAADASGFKFGAAHGVAFVADPESEQTARHDDNPSIHVDGVKDAGGRGGGLAAAGDVAADTSLAAAVGNLSAHAHQPGPGARRHRDGGYRDCRPARPRSAFGVPEPTTKRSGHGAGAIPRRLVSGVYAPEKQ